MAIPIPADDAEAQEILDQLEPIPYGTYDAAIVKTTEETVKREDSNYFGAPMINVEFDLNVNGTKRKAWRRYILKGKPLGFFFQFLDAVGVPAESVRGSNFEPQTLVARKCRLVIKKPRNNDEEGAWEVGSVLKPSAAQAAASVMP